MRYLIIPSDSEPFFTDWYIYENNYTAGMVIYDLFKKEYSKYGYDWKKIETDNL